MDAHLSYSIFQQRCGPAHTPYKYVHKIAYCYDFGEQNAASVIHFSALGKPWTVTEDTVRQQRPDAHPLLSEQFRTWRETAAMVCPAVTS